MRLAFLTVPLVLAAGVLPAAAQQDPITGAAVEFFTLRPGGATTPPPQAFGGADCRTAITAVGAERVWWGRFAGGRYISGGKHSRPRGYTTDACFGTQADCRNWMFMLKTRWGDLPKYDECRLGWNPNAPVPPWWISQARPPSYYQRFDVPPPRY